MLILSGIAGASLVAQWLRLCPSNAGGMCLNSGQGTKIPHAAVAQPKKKKKMVMLLKFQFSVIYY